jgi:hypothetical protein
MTLIRYAFYAFVALVSLSVMISLGFYTYLFLTEIEPYMQGDSIYVE